MIAFFIKQSSNTSGSSDAVTAISVVWVIFLGNYLLLGTVFKE